jgi:hypothetical protein
MKKNLRFLIVSLIAVLIPTLSYAEHSANTSNGNAHQATPGVATTALPTPHIAPDCNSIRVLKLGMRGADVACVQAHLHDEGLLSDAAVTGYFGSITKAAVVQWQMKNGVPTTGIFGQKSKAAFYKRDLHTSSTETQHSPAAPMTHAHEPLNVDLWPAVPEVSIEMVPDTMSGWNLHITTKNFTFAPERVNTAVLPNEGHTHLYIDDKKITRVYGPWYHISPTLMPGKGEHVVRVTLNANDHSDLSSKGALVEAKTTVVTVQ